jgi:hypothetical protein
MARKTMTDMIYDMIMDNERFYRASWARTLSPNSGLEVGEGHLRFMHRSNETALAEDR